MNDPYLWAIIARSLERIVAVIFGGLAIYYGYRLFQLIPTQKDNSEKIELPGISVVLSKAGPGVFFVAFGTVILLTTFFNPVSITPSKDNGNGGGYVGFMPGMKTANSVDKQEMARARLAIQVLNCILEEHGESASHIKNDDLEISITDAKLALLTNVWNENEWGEYNIFYNNLRAGLVSIDAPVYSIFNERLPGCGTRS